jgi:hypothetical protein
MHISEGPGVPIFSAPTVALGNIAASVWKAGPPSSPIEALEPLTGKSPSEASRPPSEKQGHLRLGKALWEAGLKK